MKKQHILLASILLSMPYTSFAQQITGFEEEAGQENYTSLGVYDSWSHSPFRIQQGESKPRLEGIVKVLDNTIGDEANSTSKMLMFQRSRYASNLFGARIDLKEPFELTTTVKYVHVMIKKDRPGKVVLMGLGKRRDNAEQSPETEQFWVQSSRTLEPNVWNDAVFAIKGNGGIDIHSLVVVPDCESTHELTEDFLAYIDEIEVNNSSLPRYQRGDYPLNIEENTVSAKTDRYVNNIKLSSPSAGEQTLTVGSANPQKIYRPMLDKAFTAKPGETVKPTISYNGNWMNGYVYLDYGKDGKFACEVNDNGTTPEGTDLVSYYYIETVENTSGFNYKGEPVSGDNRNTMQTPEFQIPEDLEPGFYRMRFKVDWGNADAGGRMTETNSIVSNGGSIVDVRLNIHADEGTVTTEFRNGDVLTADGNVLAGTKVKFGEPLTVWMKPENGFVPDGITLKHGHHLTGDSLVHGTAQYSTITIPAYAVNSEGMLTIPGELVDGDLHIIGNFKSTTSVGETGNYEVNFDKGLTISRTDRTLNSISLRGNKGCSYTSSNMSTAPKNVYQDKMDEAALVSRGESITPSVNYTTRGPMHGYFYIDLNNNGIFEVEVGDDHRPTDNSELVSFSYLNGYNSEGTQRGTSEAGNAITFPACQIPEFLPDGNYRARLKIDWNNGDPKGQYGANNSIQNNGGYIVDFLLNVSGESRTLEADIFNGNLYGADNSALPYQLSGTRNLEAVLHPVTDDYTLDGPVVVRTGINFDGPQEIRGNVQWKEMEIQPADIQNNTLSIPVLGNVSVKASYSPNDQAEYRLVFHDEFDGADGTRADESKWKCSQRLSATWNRFVSDDIAVAHQQDGKLVLKAIPNPDKSTDNVDMLSGAVETRDLFTFKRGKVESRAKTNGYTGNFPAIWMMPQNQKDGWPDCGEIDIFEQIDAENKSYHTVHSNWTYDLGNKNNPTSSFSKSLSMDRYHTYGLEWDENSITWFVDGVKVGSYNKSTDNSVLEQGQWPFDKAFYLILNQSVGNGSWAQNADINHTYRMDVDWIRVYQKEVSIDADDKYTPAVEGTYNAVLNRTFSQGWNTICLPFDAKAEDICAGANAQEYSSYTEAGLNFKKVETMEAGKPYLIFCPQDVTVPVTFENVSFVANAPVAVTPEGSPFSFIGSFDPISMEGRYGVANINGKDKLVRGGASSSLYTTGSYFELQDINRVNSMLLNFDRETTGIADPSFNAQNKQGDIYTLNGVLIRKDATDTKGLKKGVYIIGNQKVYIK